jgi:hypothetical protein
MGAKAVLILVLAAGGAGWARGEFGFGVDATVYRAKFRSDASPAPWAHDPGAPVAGASHEYDDGFNRVDSSGNDGGMTTYWGYQNSSQYDPAGDGTITMNSTRTILDAGRSSEGADGVPAGVVAYWQEALIGEGNCGLGFRLALHWQHISVEERTAYRSTLATISDTYALEGVLPPGAPFEGSFAGPNWVLGDAPTRVESSAAGPLIPVYRALSGDRVALDLGPTFSLDLSEQVRVVFLLGVTTVWMQSRLSYRDGTWADGSATEQKWLAGGVAGMDLQCRLGELWGAFAGVAASKVPDFTQRVEGHTARMPLEGVTMRAGLFFQR